MMGEEQLGREFNMKNIIYMLHHKKKEDVIQNLKLEEIDETQTQFGDRKYSMSKAQQNAFDFYKEGEELVTIVKDLREIRFDLREELKKSKLHRKKDQAIDVDSLDSANSNKNYD